MKYLLVPFQLLFLILLRVVPVHPFSSPSLFYGDTFLRHNRCCWRLHASSSSTSNSDAAAAAAAAASPAAADPSALRVSEIKSELKERGVNFSDCFDKESLVQRLKDARDGRAQQHQQAARTTNTADPDTKATSDAFSESPSSPRTPREEVTSSGKTTATFSDEDILKELRAMSVRDLRHDLAIRNVRWGGLLEKEDLVQALFKAKKEALNFSVTGKIVPCEVATLTGDEATEEISCRGGISTPLLLDVYAVWCGPCQLMAPQLQQAAFEFKNRVRVAKMDSDQYPDVAGQLRVQGLPTLVLFRDGKEITRIEGALLKEQIVQWVEENM